MRVTQAKCSNCGAILTINGKSLITVCDYCGTPFFLEQAGEKSDFVVRGGILEQYNGTSLDVVIPDEVSRIGKNVFRGMNIQSVVLAPNVTFIDEGAFCDCRSLVSVTFSERLQEINSAAFAQCGLVELRIPGGVKIGPGAFNECSQLSTVVIENGVTSIGECAFRNCRKLSSIKLPESIENSIYGIQVDAFMGCCKLEYVQLPESLSEDIIHFGFFDTPWYKKRDQIKKASAYRKAGRCQYCGGEFSGIFSKKCSQCKRPKDY